VIGVHKLPRESFDAICTGTPDEIGLAVLGAGQRSKALLLLRLLVDQLPHTYRRAGSPVGEAVALLDAVRRHRPAAADRLFGYPYVTAGLVNLVRMLRSGGPPEPALTLLATMAATAAVHSGQEFELTGVPAAGPVHLPGLGTARVGAGPVRLALEGGRTLVGDVLVPQDPTTDADGWLGVRPLTGDPDGAVLDDLDPYRAFGYLRPASRTPPGKVEQWRSAWTSAVDHLRDRHPVRNAQVRTVLSVVTPLDADRPGQGQSASAWQAYGAVASTAPSHTAGFAATLVHESQHSVLNALGDLVDLFDPADDALYYSPWRADPRPLRGLLHGCYAFLGVADFWARERSSPRFEFEYAKVALQVRQALETVAPASALTPDGRHLVASMARHAATLGEVPPPGPVGRLARLAAEDHRISWRLRVMAPNPALVDAAASAWTAGGGAPALTEDALLRSATEVFVPSRRARWIGHLAGTGTTLDGTEADNRLARHDYEGAASAYSDAVRGGHDDEDTWTGLALAGARTHGPGARVWRLRPELVRTIHGAVLSRTGQPPDPLSLARWLADGLPD
jgi:HEXXH motif-containing protein